jgi:hypothetical protein
VTHVVLDVGHALTVPEVRAALHGRGLDAAPCGAGASPVSKAVADALAAAVRRGDLRRPARGVYQPVASS